MRAIDKARGLGIRVPAVHRVTSGSTVQDAWYALSWWIIMSLGLQLNDVLVRLSKATSLTASEALSDTVESPWIEA
jgi:hypothetical protein